MIAQFQIFGVFGPWFIDFLVRAILPVLALMAGVGLLIWYLRRL